MLFIYLFIYFLFHRKIFLREKKIEKWKGHGEKKSLAAIFLLNRKQKGKKLRLVHI